MENTIILFGSIVALFSLIFIFSKKNTNYEGKPDINLNKIELDYKELKDQVIDFMREFNRTATFHTNLLDEKITYMQELRQDIDRKILDVTKMMTDVEILSNRLYKIKYQLEEVKPVEKSTYEEKNKKTVKKPRKSKESNKKILSIDPQINEASEDDIEAKVVEYYKKGMDIKSIANKTGKSIGEVEFITSLEKMR